MELTLGFILVAMAGVLQGSFFLPMTYTRNWKWEHNWFVFSFFAMLVINWLIAILLINNLGQVIRHIPRETFWIVLVSGSVWGLGTILFGKAMEKLGMALGYPIIMGISAVAGIVIPAIIFSPELILTLKGWIIMTGALLSIAGIKLCAKASAKKEETVPPDTNFSRKWLIIGVISGFTSCLPNIGAAFSTNITEIALSAGNRDFLASNVVWCLFFTMGALINVTYALYLILKGKSSKTLVLQSGKNWLLILAMSIMWISSLYIYGAGSFLLGNIGLLVGWPLLVILSVLIGNLWGIFRGEWLSATAYARKILNNGLWILLIAIGVIASSNLFVKQPKIKNITLKGEPVAKTILQVCFDKANPQVKCRYAWSVSESRDGPWEKLQGINTQEIVLLTNYSGKFLQCEVSPINDDGSTGKPFSAISGSPVVHKGNPNTDWIKNAGLGVMLHFLKAVFVKEGGPKEWNEVVDHFDVERFAEDCKKAGAGFVMLALGQNDGYYCSPNSAYDSIVGVRPGELCSKRDLPADLFTALDKRGIRMMLYLPGNPPIHHRLVDEKFRYTFGRDSPTSQFTQTCWEAVIREWSLRYGKKNSGWWFDGMYHNGIIETRSDMSLPHNISTHTLAAKKGNFNSIVCYNYGVDKIQTDSPYDDYSAGEENNIGQVPKDRWVVDGAQWFHFTFIGKNWGGRETRFKLNELTSWAKEVFEKEGVLCFDISADKTGQIIPGQVAQVRAVRETLEQARKNTVSFASLLQQLTDRTVIVQKPSHPYRLLQASSFDRRSVKKDGEGWYANDDWSNYIRKEVVNGKDEYVVMDTDGPGAITRFWTGGHPKQINHLRIYVDGSKTPVWKSATTGELIGQNAEIGYPLSYRSVDKDSLNMNQGAQPGHNLYAPIPFQKHLKITSDCPKGDAGKGFWYDINYRLYDKGTPVESFSKETPLQHKTILNQANNQLSTFMKLKPNMVKIPGENKKTAFAYSIKSQETKSFPVTRPGSLRRITLLLNAANRNEAVKDTWVRIRFDGTTTVDVPLGFFFGCGDQILTVSDWYRKVGLDGNMACFWVMPYQRSANIELINKGKQTISGNIEIATGDWFWDERSLYFHSSFKQLGMPGKITKDFNYVDLKGQAGMYAGDVLQVEKWFRGWWGEGDEKIYIDGSTFPDHFGTGTEDYYGYAWGHPETFNQIFTNQPIGNANTGEGGISVNSRVRSLDAIPFKTSLRFDMESWQKYGGPVNYSVACFWYGKNL